MCPIALREQMALQVGLVGALLDILPQELRNVAYSGYDNRALYVADAGVQAMTLSIEEQSVLGLAPLTSLSYQYPLETDGSQAHYDVRLVDNGSSYGGVQYYAIQADGYSPQGDHRRVVAVVQQGCFCGYNYLGKQNSPGNVFVAGLTQFNGPVYLESDIGGAPIDLQWYNGAALLFQDSATISGYYEWYGPGGVGGTPPTSVDNWNPVDSLRAGGLLLLAGTASRTRLRAVMCLALIHI